MDIVNTLEIRVISMRRSGHHAFIAWLANNCRGNGCILNLPSLRGNIFDCIYNAHLYENNGVFDLDLEKERAGEFSKKEYLIYNLENEDLTIFLDDTIEKHHDTYVGRSGTRYDILMLRDPFNLFASSLRFFYNVPSLSFPRYIDRMTTLWKQYAKEYLGITDFLPMKKVDVNFNAWYDSEDVRCGIAETLGLRVKNNAIDFVPPFGGGSSFRRGDGKGGNVLARWKYFTQSRLYKSLFDEETIALSEHIFGRLPGTEMFYPTKASFFQKQSTAMKIQWERLPYAIRYHRRHLFKLLKWVISLPVIFFRKLYFSFYKSYP